VKSEYHTSLRSSCIERKLSGFRYSELLKLAWELQFKNRISPAIFHANNIEKKTKNRHYVLIKKYICIPSCICYSRTRENPSPNFLAVVKDLSFFIYFFCCSFLCPAVYCNLYSRLSISEMHRNSCIILSRQYKNCICIQWAILQVHLLRVFNFAG
jgi:hypothetical protein